MTPMDWSLMITAALSGLAGLGLLFRAWKQPGSRAVLAAGWLALAAACVLAFFGNGDRGVAQLSVIVMAGATAPFAVPLARGIAPPAGAGRARSRPPDPATSRRWGLQILSGIWTFLLTGPVAGAIAMFAAACLFELMRPAQGSPATAGILAIIAAVLLWAVLSVLLLIEPRAGRRSAYAGLALAATAAIAFV